MALMRPNSKSKMLALVEELSENEGEQNTHKNAQGGDPEKEVETEADEDKNEHSIEMSDFSERKKKK